LTKLFLCLDDEYLMKNNASEIIKFIINKNIEQCYYYNSIERIESVCVTFDIKELAQLAKFKNEKLIKN